MRRSPIATSRLAECSPASRLPSLRSALRDLDPGCAPGWCLIVGDGQTDASGGGFGLRCGRMLQASHRSYEAYDALWHDGLIDPYPEFKRHFRPPSPGDCEGSLPPRLVVSNAMVRESVSEMAAPVLVGPQHAPSPASGSPRVRMEARQIGGGD